MYQSDKLICVGTNSIASGRVAIRRFARLIQKLGYDVQLNKVTVTNIVTTFSLKCTVNLGNFASFIGFKAYYDPQRFPLLIIDYGGKRKPTFSVELMLTGVKSIVQLNDLYSTFYLVI
ncbi:TATA-box-binding protein 2-like [Oppia nitens]|uniref:TATA-box-binding protein 2-like n=1 Tax=Oppia nitens TaxID=1686743 RepID=UPI0023DC594D|nr:TATA-box-binding protein 2-like [Oppia nitens]